MTETDLCCKNLLNSFFCKLAIQEWFVERAFTVWGMYVLTGIVLKGQSFTHVVKPVRISLHVRVEIFHRALFLLDLTVVYCWLFDGLGPVSWV